MAAATTWRPGTIVQGASEYAYDTDENLRILRFRQQGGEWHWFAAGDSYYREYPTRFIATVPCLGYIAIEENNQVVYKPSMCFGRFQHQKDIPLTEETLLEFQADPNAIDIIDMAHIADDQQFDVMVRQILARARTIQVFEVDGSTSVRHVIFEYEILWCWDQSREILYSEQVVHPDHHVEVMIDRPLRGAPVIDKAMYNQFGLNPLAYEDLTDRHGCVIAQLVTTEITKTQSGKGSRKGGHDTRRLVKVNPTPEEINTEFDIIFRSQ